MVEKVVLSTRPVAIEYRITPLGKTLRPPIDAILAWAREHLPAIEEARSRLDDQPPPPRLAAANSSGQRR